MFEKKQFTNPDEAIDYEERLKIAGFKETKIVKEYGKIYVYYKRY